MMTLSRRTLPRLLLAAGMLLASPFAFAAQGLAQELAPGATGMVANTGGEPILLRNAPDWNAATVASYVEGTPLQVAEGPLYDANGSAWLGVVIDANANRASRTIISTAASTVNVYVIPTDEDAIIASHAQDWLASRAT